MTRPVDDPPRRDTDAATTTTTVHGDGTAAVQERPSGRDWRGWLVLGLALGSVIAFFGIAAGAGIGLWGWQEGIAALRWTGVAALVAIVIAIIAIVVNRRRGRKIRWPLLILGLVVALGFIGWLASYIVTAQSLPAIHDITTDLADPPAFRELTVRADNWDNIPGADDDDMRGMSPRQRWEVLHADAYPDVRSVRIDSPVTTVLAKARRLAEDRDWEIVGIDPIEGRLEAVDTVSLFRFKDDIVIRARPADSGAASIIDMRSVSRVGVHDLGENAERIREFLSDLSGTTTSID